MPIVFEMYLGFVLIRYDKMTDRETTALKKESVTIAKRRRCAMLGRATQGRDRVSQEARRVRGKCKQVFIPIMAGSC